MKMEHLKLVIVDMDGTLLVNHHDTSKENINALIKLQEKGVKVAIASGRNVKGLKPFIEQLKLEQYGGYCVGNNGQELLDIASGELEVGARIPYDIAYQAIRFGIDHDFQVFGHSGDYRFFYIPQGVRVARPWININNYDEEEFIAKRVPMDKIGYFICDNETVRYAEEVNILLDGKAHALAVNEETLELVPIGVDKVVGVDSIAKKNGYKLEEVLIFGDGHNDIKMMSKYPSVAMKNAYPEIKKVSEYQTRSNSRNGVAYFIENFIL